MEKAASDRHYRRLHLRLHLRPEDPRSQLGRPFFLHELDRYSLEGPRHSRIMSTLSSESLNTENAVGPIGRPGALSAFLWIFRACPWRPWRLQTPKHVQTPQIRTSES